MLLDKMKLFILNLVCFNQVIFDVELVVRLFDKFNKMVVGLFGLISSICLLVWLFFGDRYDNG